MSAEYPGDEIISNSGEPLQSLFKSRIVLALYANETRCGCIYYT